MKYKSAYQREIADLGLAFWIWLANDDNFDNFQYISSILMIQTSALAVTPSGPIKSVTERGGWVTVMNDLGPAKSVTINGVSL